MREIELKPSRWLGLLLVAMASLALAAIGLAAVPTALQLALGALVIGLEFWAWRRVSRLETLRVTNSGQLQALDKAGAWNDIEVLGDSFVSGTLIVLRYRIPGAAARSLTLLPDSAAADDLRRLRVSLRWTRHTRSDTSTPDAG